MFRSISRWVAIWLFIELSCTQVFAQDAEIRAGRNQMENGDYAKAIATFQDVLKNSPGNAGAIMGLAEAYLLSGDYGKSVELYKKVSRTPSLKGRDLKLFGKALLLSGDFLTASSILKDFLRTEPLEFEAKHLSMICDTLEQMISTQISYDVFTLPGNSPMNETAPALFGKDLVFSSSRVDKSKPDTNFHKQELYKTEISRKGDNYAYFRSALLNGQRNWKSHEFGFTWDEKTGLIAYTRASSEYSFRRYADTATTRAEIWVGATEGAGWLKMQPFTWNSAEYSCLLPCFGENADVLYFVSDMPGGIGGYDIWRSERQGDVWKEPVNLGAAVNTAGDELYPFYHRDGVLYFASNGYKKAGDLDVYFTRFEPGTGWSLPEVMAAPVNSPHDDFGFILEPDKRHGFMASNRPGGQGGDDLYSLIIREPYTECVPHQELALCYNFFDQNDRGSLPTYSYKYRWEFGDGDIGYREKLQHCFKGPGEYRVKLTIIDTAFNAIFDQVETLLSLEEPSQAVITGTLTGTKGQPVQLDGSKSLLQGFRILGYKWDMGDGTILAGEKVNHAWKKAGTYTITLKVAGINEDLKKVWRACTFRTVTINP